MIAMLFVYPIGIFLTTVFFVTLFIIAAHRKAAAGRPYTPVPVPQALREFYEEPPPPAPKPRPTPKPAPPEPVLYMRRWGFLRQRWEVEEKAQWDKDFGLLDRKAPDKAPRKEDLYERLRRVSFDEAPAEKTPAEKELFDRLRENLRKLG